MPQPRRSQISLEDTLYYHCCSRVVRRAFLCGDDKYSDENYDHRQEWVESLLLKLASVFAIDIRRANQEDNCRWRFCEGRFKSQALLDDAALLACMAYVDLNPIRAKLAETPGQSENTSIKLRIEAALREEEPKTLLPFSGNECQSQPHLFDNALHFSFPDYIGLVDETGRIIRDDKCGYITENSAKMLTRLNISQENGLKFTHKFGSIFHGPVGSLEELTHYCDHLQKRQRHFAGNCQYFKTG